MPDTADESMSGGGPITDLLTEPRADDYFGDREPLKSPIDPTLAEPMPPLMREVYMTD